MIGNNLFFNRINFKFLNYPQKTQELFVFKVLMFIEIEQYLSHIIWYKMLSNGCHNGIYPYTYYIQSVFLFK